MKYIMFNKDRVEICIIRCLFGDFILVMVKYTNEQQNDDYWLHRKGFKYCKSIIFVLVIFFVEIFIYSSPGAIFRSASCI